MMTPKRRLSTLTFACLCFKKSFLIKIIIIVIIIIIIIIIIIVILTLTIILIHLKYETCEYFLITIGALLYHVGILCLYCIFYESVQN